MDPTLRRSLWRPPEEPRTSAQLRALAAARSVFLGIAIALDLGLWPLLGGSPGIRVDVLHRALGANIALLAIDLLLTQTLLRRHSRLRSPIELACIAIEALTCAVWLQATGSLSSYFIALCLLVVFLYRLMVGYWQGVVFLAGIALAHGSAIALETMGSLRPMSLFEDQPAGPYANGAFSVAAMLSISGCYLGAFIGAGVLDALLQKKDRAIAAARRDVALAMEGARLGRLSGTIVGGAYELTEVIGRGGMGEVYQAKRLRDGQDVAIKMLHPHLASSPEQLSRFRREAAAAGRIPAVHVAAVLELGEGPEGSPFIAMELLRGEDLSALLRRRDRLPLLELLPLVDAIAAALEAAHALGIVHRDLKPGNVFLPGSGGIRLLDFGIARLDDASSEAATVLTTGLIGSPGYLAPEQVRTPAAVGAQVDVFALGAICYRALTGRAPFPSRNPVEAVYEALHLHPERPSRLAPELGPDVDCVLALALAKATADRYATARELARDLRAALDGGLPEATRARAQSCLARMPEHAGAEPTLTTTL